MPQVNSTRYVDHESGEEVVVYWIITDDGRKVYTDSQGNPK